MPCPPFQGHYTGLRKVHNRLFDLCTTVDYPLPSMVASLGLETVFGLPPARAVFMIPSGIQSLYSLQAGDQAKVTSRPRHANECQEKTDRQWGAESEYT